MSKILVVSDTHDSIENFRKLLLFEKEFDFLIHLGDIESREDEIRQMAGKVNPLAGFVRVTGNCDEEIGVPYRIFEWDGVRLFLTHGHRYGVKYGRTPKELAAAALAKGCHTALFGHTHVPYLNEESGVVLFNPGSLSRPRQEDRRAAYGMIFTADGEVKRIEQRYL